MKNRHTKGIARKSSRLKRKVTASLMKYTPVQVLVNNKRAISPVVSHLILIAAVIVLGFAALAYARNISNDYQTQYRQSVNSDIDRLKETLAFECVFCNSSHVKVFFINAGSISVDVDKVYLSTSSNNVSYTFKYLNGSIAPDHTLGLGAERQIVVQQALSSGTYTVKITTVRGSSFAYSFTV